MKRQWLHKLLSIILLGVFALHNTPREFIHLLAPHQDTVDDYEHQCSHPGPAFSVKHKHCDFLQIGVPPYEHITYEYAAPATSITWVYTFPHIPATAIQFFADASLRGPPAIG